MKSPFAIFRKHQKVATVVLTGLAMFAFVILGSLDQMSGQLPRSVVVLLFAAGFACVLGIVGLRSGKPKEYAMAGALIGAVFALVFQFQNPPPAAVQTTIGNLSHQELDQLISRRQIANDFIRNAYQKSRPFPSHSNQNVQGFLQIRWERELSRFLFGFGRSPKEDVVLGYLLSYEADRMGIEISDETVHEYIRKVNEKLTVEDFTEIRTEMRLIETELYDALSGELKAWLALQLLAPRNMPTPEQYWQLYRKLNVMQELDTAAVPVAPFADDVPHPSPPELNSYFEQHQHDFDNQRAPGEPGFRQPRKIRIEHLEADYETIESQIPEVTGEEIEKYYHENRELYRNKLIPGGEKEEVKADESKQILPEFTPEEGSKPDGSKSDRKTDGKNHEDNKNKNDSKPDKKTEPSKQQEDDKKPSDIKPNEKKPEGEKDSEKEKPLPEFRPLDDELKSEIREQLLRQRTLEKMKAKIDEATHFMFEHGDEFSKSSAEGAKKGTPQAITDRLKSFAKEHHLRYVKTDLLSAEEFVNTEKYSIVEAIEPVNNPLKQLNARTTVRRLFDSQPDQLYTVDEAQDPLSNNRYVYWKIEDVESHVPTFDEPGVEEQVLEAWKREKARPMAEKRAEELAAVLRESDKSMSETFSNETVTGEEDGLLMTVLPTDSFSWLRRPAAPGTDPFSAPRAVLSTISGIDKAGNDFMRTVFDGMTNGEVKAVPNADKSVYYVVQVKNRTSSTPEGEEKHRQDFMRENLFGSFHPLIGRFPTTYDYLTEREQLETVYRWSRQLESESKYGVAWSQE